MKNMAIFQPPPVVAQDGIIPLESHKSLQDPRFGDLLSMGRSEIVNARDVAGRVFYGLTLG